MKQDTHEEFWLKQHFGKLDEDVKAKKKPPKYTLPDGVQARYETAHLEWFKIRFPSAYKDGHYLKPKIPDYQTANGLTNWITNYMDWSGGDGNRISTVGRQVQGKWIKGQTKKGTGDTQCIHPNGVSFIIEVKISDKPSPDQLERQAKIRKAGGIYEFCHTPMEFFEIYDKVGKIIVSRPLGLFD